MTRNRYEVILNFLFTLRECVEKLQLLKTPEERQRRLEETLEIHVDPNMDPSYESEEDEGEGDDKKQGRIQLLVKFLYLKFSGTTIFVINSIINNIAFNSCRKLY